MDYYDKPIKPKLPLFKVALTISISWTGYNELYSYQSELCVSNWINEKTRLQYVKRNLTILF